MALVTCQCAFPLCTLGQSVLPILGISFPPLCSHMCALLCALICVLSYVCSHMCALIGVLSYVCSHMCALISVLSYACSPDAVFVPIPPTTLFGVFCRDNELSSHQTESGLSKTSTFFTFISCPLDYKRIPMFATYLCSWLFNPAHVL